MNMKKKRLASEMRRASAWHNEISGKIARMKKDGADLAFRNSLGIPLKGFGFVDHSMEGSEYSKWHSRQTVKDGLAGYAYRLEKDAHAYGFNVWEMETLEEYLLFGGAVVSRGGSDRYDHEADMQFATRTWDAPGLFMRIDEMRKNDKSFEQIAKELNSIRRPEGIPPVSATRLRKIHSRGVNRLAKSDSISS
jgi:hypothetical protein